ncbi:thiamine pyrophosphate-dependent enzyme [Pararcticibacter amylolyticus]|uniref:Ubiquinone-dependent pyruvate dehydrogenase n=1 Tax=Pararcticibacter amylolyticus TaxID=2173175 RepID=A0A2U2PGI6_9SPHI|nr:thiamine pyrophosphate-dependent enzyme [Pararcticibacter amylolyticus]PWG80511.1 ubiquinone-dependent pyruvate dehydrogenase [Pararcticibacter amylolyticus]
MAKVAEQVVDILVEAGIKRIYAVTGDSLNEINDAVRRNGKIDWVHVRHEETGAFAAGAEAQLNGLACCAGSSGPGHVHLVNGLYDAHRSGASVIAIASTCPSNEFGTDYFQETNTIRLFDDCSCYNVLANTPTQVPRMLQAAVQHAVHKKGVAVLGLPGDLAMQNAENGMTSTKAYHTESIIRPSDTELANLANLISQYKKITIFGGIGCENAHEEVVALARKLKAPVGYSFRGKMALQHDNPYEVGMTGLLGLPSAYHSMKDAELLILLGTDFPYSNFIPEDCKIVQLDVKPERIGRRAKVDIGLHGQVKASLQALLPILAENTDDSFLRQQLDFYGEVKRKMQTYVDDRGDVNIIHPEFVAAEIDKLASDDAIFTVDTGMCCVWGARYIRATAKRKMLGSFNHGSMANALPQAIGAAFAAPNRQVVALCGDGGLSMMLGDMATIVQYNLPVKLVVFNNRSLGMVKLEMEVAGLPDWQTDMYNPDFAALAQSMGMRGFSAAGPDQVRDALVQAFAHNGPALVNVMTDPNALAMPPKTEFDQIRGFAISMTRLMLNGKMDEVIDTIKSNYKHIKDML